MKKIKKAPGAKTNTYAAEVEGAIGYLKTNRQEARNFEALFTSDAAGETLSIRMGDTYITLNFEDVQRLIDVTRAERKAAAQ